MIHGEKILSIVTIYGTDEENTSHLPFSKFLILKLLEMHNKFQRCWNRPYVFFTQFLPMITCYIIVVYYQNQDFNIGKCVCIILYHFITYLDLDYHHWRQDDTVFHYHKNLWSQTLSSKHWSYFYFYNSVLLRSI